MKEEELKRILKKIKFHSGEDYIGIENGNEIIEIQGIEDKSFYWLVKKCIKEGKQSKLKKELDFLNFLKGCSIRSYEYEINKRIKQIEKELSGGGE